MITGLVAVEPNKDTVDKFAIYHGLTTSFLELDVVKGEDALIKMIEADKKFLTTTLKEVTFLNPNFKDRIRNVKYKTRTIFETNELVYLLYKYVQGKKKKEEDTIKLSYLDKMEKKYKSFITSKVILDDMKIHNQ